MMTFIAIVHIIVAVLLIALVLLQDSKSNGALGIGGSGSNSLLGATGAQTLAAKITMWAAVVFAVTCLGLTYYTSSSHQSVVDSLPLPVAPVAAPQEAAPATDQTAAAGSPATETTAPAETTTAPTAPANQ